MAPQYGYLVIGAGMAGAAAARALADAGKTVLVLERRDHVGGNAYDRVDAAGILIHQYGPHIFHTSDRRVYDFLSRFTSWRDYQHRVAANIPVPGGRQELPVPFNLVSLEAAYGPERAAVLERKLLAAYGPNRKVTILDLRTSPDPEIAALADYVYAHIFVRYTVKQWGKPPEEIDPATTARVPVFLSRDCRYFQDPWQGMPANGYTAMFQAMLDRPGITVALGTEAADRLSLEEDGSLRLDGVPFPGGVIYTGPVDALFSCRFGALPYRTLEFCFETHPTDRWQSHGTINYTMDQDYTRITEFKHLTGQVRPGATTTVKEYARDYTGAAGEVPCYPVVNPETSALYARYRDYAAAWPQLRLLGRLAEYKYYNMDAIAARALALCDQLLK